MRSRLIPSDDAFFGLFNDSAGNVAECARRLRDLLSDPVDPASHEKIAACEHTGIPVSTTHTITGSIVGVGAARRLSAVRWGVAGRVVWAWVLTIPGAFTVSFLAFLVVDLVS